MLRWATQRRRDERARRRREIREQEQAKAESGSSPNPGKFFYTEAHLVFLRDGYARMPVRELTKAFNRAFGLAKSETSIKAALSNHRITCGRKHGERMMPMRLYSKQEAGFLRDQYAGRSVEELTALFNEQFGRNMTKRQIKTFVHNRGITSGRTGHFEVGQKSWNAGTRGRMKPNSGSFKRGHVPHTKMRLWSERINRDGYIEISIPETNPYTGAPTRFKLKSVWLWECEHGAVPDGHVVVFIDGDKLNCVLENLMLVTRAELLSLNLHGYKDTPEDLKPTVMTLAKLETKAGIRSCPGRGRAACREK